MLSESSPGLPPVKVQGQIFELNYQITVEGRPIVSVDAEYSGVGRALMGKTTYRLVFEPGLDENVHAAVIGIAIALDMRREKMPDLCFAVLSRSCPSSGPAV